MRVSTRKQQGLEEEGSCLGPLAPPVAQEFLIPMGELEGEVWATEEPKKRK